MFDEKRSPVTRGCMGHAPISPNGLPCLSSIRAAALYSESNSSKASDAQNTSTTLTSQEQWEDSRGRVADFLSVQRIEENSGASAPRESSPSFFASVSVVDVFAHRHCLDELDSDI